MQTAKKKHFIGAWVKPETKKKLATIAKREDRSLAYTIEKILSEGVHTVK